MAKAKKKATKSAAKRGKVAGKGKRTTRRKSAAKRTVVAPRGDERYVRRSESGEFRESDDMGRSLSVDRRRQSKKKAKRGQGDRGDR